MLTVKGKPAFHETRGWTAGKRVSSPLFVDAAQLFPQVNGNGDGLTLIPRLLAAAVSFNASARVLHSPMGMR
jgi:hypothetical protein